MCEWGNERMRKWMREWTSEVWHFSWYVLACLAEHYKNDYIWKISRQGNKAIFQNQAEGRHEDGHTVNIVSSSLPPSPTWRHCYPTLWFSRSCTRDFIFSENDPPRDTNSKVGKVCHACVNLRVAFLFRKNRQVSGLTAGTMGLKGGNCP